MSHTISVTLGDNGPATGATVTLSDANGTYGIRRADDNVVVVAAGAALTHAGSGVYTYAFTAGVAGTAYEAKVKVVWPDGSTDYVDDLFTVASGTPTPLQQAQSILTQLYAASAAADGNGGIISTSIDGQSVTFENFAQLQQRIQFWERKVALLSGARRRTSTIFIGGC